MTVMSSATTQLGPRPAVRDACLRKVVSLGWLDTPSRPDSRWKCNGRPGLVATMEGLQLGGHCTSKRHLGGWGVQPSGLSLSVRWCHLGCWGLCFQVQDQAPGVVGGGDPAVVNRDRLLGLHDGSPTWITCITGSAGPWGSSRPAGDYISNGIGCWTTFITVLARCQLGP